MNKPHMSECIAARLVLVLFICLCLLVPAVTIIGRASAEEAGTPTDTSQEMQIAPEYAVKFSHTADWSRQTQELLKITIVDKYQSGYAKVEIRIDGDAWQNVTGDMSNDHTYKFYLWKNCDVSVRITDKIGKQHTQKKTIEIFDHTNPTVEAGIRSTMLHVEAADGQSGIAGVKVNDLLFTTLVDGKLDIKLQEMLNGYEKLRVYSFDNAGNTSETVVLTNPYYLAPTKQPTATPEPTATPKPTKRPSSGGNNSGSSSTNKPKETPPAEPTATAAPVVTAAPMVTPYIVGPGQPYINSGNMQTLDMLYASHTNKQFITVQTKNGETYYMVIDYDKPIDENGDIYETYFLNLVDDRDLLDVIDEKDVPTPTPTIVPTPTPTSVPVVTDPVVPPEKPDNTPMMGMAVIALVALGGIGFWFIKNKGGKPSRSSAEPEYDDEEDEDDEIID